MYDRTFYMTILIGLQIIMFFSLKDHDKVLKTRNKQRRYGNLLTSMIVSIPFAIIIIVLTNLKELSMFIDLNVKIIAVIGCILFYLVFKIVGKIVFIPVNCAKQDKEKSYHNHNYKGWRYYIIQYPASTLENMLELPPVNKLGKSNTKLMKKYHNNRLKLPPRHIRYILLLMVYICTSIGFFTINSIMEQGKLIYINLYVVPFLLLISLVGHLIFGIIRFFEYIANIKVNEIINFLIFNMMFSAFIGGSISYILNK